MPRLIRFCIKREFNENFERICPYLSIFIYKDINHIGIVTVIVLYILGKQLYMKIIKKQK